MSVESVCFPRVWSSTGKGSIQSKGLLRKTGLKISAGKLNGKCRQDRGLMTFVLILKWAKWGVMSVEKTSPPKRNWDFTPDSSIRERNCNAKWLTVRKHLEGIKAECITWGWCMEAQSWCASSRGALQNSVHMRDWRNTISLIKSEATLLWGKLFAWDLRLDLILTTHCTAYQVIFFSKLE